MDLGISKGAYRVDLEFAHRNLSVSLGRDGSVLVLCFLLCLQQNRMAKEMSENTAAGGAKRNLPKTICKDIKCLLLLFIDYSNLVHYLA